MRKGISTLAAALAAATFAVSIVPTQASAHVTLAPKSAAAGSWSTFAVKVPNESDTASTIKLVLKMPEGVTYASWQPVPGWNAEIQKAKLSKPLQTEDGPVSEAVSQIVWTADGKGVQPGQFQQFPITILVPDVAGSELAFRAVQTYSDGKVSRWIGSPESDEPAPTVSVTGKVDEHGSSGSGDHDSSDSSHQALAIAGLALGGLALLTAIAALVVARRSRK